MRFAVTALLCLWAFGCGEADELDCAQVVYKTCDIRQSTCQDRIFDQMRCLRGDTDVDERPRSVVVTEDELRDQLQASLDSAELDPDVERTYAALAVLGLIDLEDTTVDSQVDFQVEGLLGFYSHVTKEVVIVDHGEPLDDEMANTTLGHEYVHALQDREFDLSDYRREHSFSYDSALASTSVTEGEATLYDGFQLGKLHDREPSELDWVEYFSHFADAANEFAVKERSPLLVASAVFPYTYGPFGSASAFAGAGQPGIERSRSRDLSTQSIMSRALSETRFAPSGPLDELAVGRVPGRRSLGADSLGAWLLHSFGVRVLGEPLAPAMALGWRGDALSVFYDAVSDATELVWKIRWSSASRAQSFADKAVLAQAGNGGSLLAFAAGDTSVILTSTLGEADFLDLLSALDADDVAAPSRSPSELAQDGPSALTQALARFGGHCFR